MGFKQTDNEGRGGYARVWKVEDKGNYSVCEVSTSRKKQGSDRDYEVDFQNSYVRFVGKAHDAIQRLAVGEKGISIQITSCDVTNKYDKSKDKVYTNYVVFDFLLVGNDKPAQDEKPSKASKKSAKSKPSEPVEEDEDDLPF